MFLFRGSIQDTHAWPDGADADTAAPTRDMVSVQNWPTGALNGGYLPPPRGAAKPNHSSQIRDIHGRAPTPKQSWVSKISWVSL